MSYVRSTRSKKYGTQPVPPSDSAIRMSGKSLITRDQRRSAAAEQMFMGWSVIMTSTGASGLVTVIEPEEPRWMDITIPSSQRAVQSGSHDASWKLGYPRL